MQQHVRWIARGIRTALGLILLTCAAWAGVPSAPTNLVAEQGGINGFSGVRLEWDRNNETIAGFRIYMSPDGGNNYRQIDEVGDSAGTTRFFYTTRPLDNGYYVFYVTAFNEEGESSQSNFATITLDGVGVRFTRGWMTDTVMAGTAMAQTFTAEASDGAPVIYSITNPQAGMAIDAATGLFTWTPEYAGHYHVEIRATHPEDQRASSYTAYTIIVKALPAALCANITGSVAFPDGLPVASGHAQASMIRGDGSRATYIGKIIDGEFSIAVEEGDWTLYVYGSGIRPEYYSDAATEAAATPIELGCDQTSEIRMTVDRQITYHNVLAGTLVDTAGNQLNGRLLAYRIGGNGEPGEFVETWARGGWYGFYRLEPGEYVVWGSAQDSMHVPGYHVAGNVASMVWTGATRINIGANDSIFDVEVRLVYMDGFGGQARLRGNVVSDGGSIRKSDDPHILGTTPVEGATVFALDAANSVAGYATTDANGTFLVTDLKPGAYTVLVDRVGLKPLWSSATVTTGETIVDLLMESATSSAPLSGAGVSAPRLFPNPIDRAATLRFNATAGTAAVTLSDLRGETLLSQSVATVDGENSLRIDTDSLPNGTYLLKLVSRGGTTTIIVTVAR